MTTSCSPVIQPAKAATRTIDGYPRAAKPRKIAREMSRS